MAKDMKDKAPKGLAKGKQAALPQAVDDAVMVSEDATAAAAKRISVADLLGNDKGGKAISLAGVEGSGAGTIAISADGTEIVYDANGAFDHLAEGETATDSFDYTIQLANGALSTATVTVTITGAAEAPDGPSIVNITNGGAGENYHRSLSQDGSKLIFQRVSDPDVSAWLQDTFIYDLETGQTTEVPALANAWATDYVISPDGSTVAFESWDNLLELENFHYDVSYMYLYDVETGAMRTITEGSVRVSWGPMFSADGSTLVFNSHSDNLNGIDENGYIWDENGQRPDVIVHDLESGRNFNITDDGDWDYYHFALDVSSDGSMVTYHNQTDPYPDSDPFIMENDLLLHDRTTGESIKIADGTFNTIDGGGVFVSSAGFIDNDSKLVFTRSEDYGTGADVLIYDLETGATTTVGQGARNVSAQASTILYTTAGATVVDNQPDTYGRSGDVVAYDIETGITTSLTEGSNGGIAGLQLSADGSKVIFSSNATNLIDGEVDLNGDIADVFIFDMNSGAMANITNGGNGDSYVGDISADGSRAIFTSHATNLVEGVIDTNGNQLDVFVFEI
ncbi:Ig-like domain-containing protein [uncultured Paracoccus sp.]|uniref:Ig-like domain-containing protein n=1 Tax=uncultured Paracoccus sp. TaxID=189685 RepID=UPI002610C509|nr:Ig-like domain-containing protein [uncultured Paracoccus sp.]